MKTAIVYPLAGYERDRWLFCERTGHPAFAS